MPGADYSRIRDVFLRVQKLPGGERPAALEALCGDDADLRAEVESLLGHESASLDPAVARRRFAEALESEDEEALPESIGPYRILRRLAEGGMGIVYLAEQENPGRTVAVKIIRGVQVTRELLLRFELEVKVLASLQHPGVAQIFEAGVAESRDELGNAIKQPFFAMEYIEGEALTDHVRLHALGVRERLELFVKICDAVDHAHREGVVHRDLKPANVIVDRNGQPKILDFGAARAADLHREESMLTRAGQVIGTLAYMSPEQFSGDSVRVDARSDIYSLGVLLYQMLTGELPHRLGDTSLAEAARVVRDEDIQPIGFIDSRFRGDIDTIVGRALAKERERRYSSAGDLGDDVRRHLNDLPIEARPVSTVYRLRKFGRRNRGVMASLVATFIVLLAGISVSAYFAYCSSQSEQEAIASREDLRIVHRSSISAALSASWVGDFPAASRHLDDVPEAYRGSWEYRHLRARIDPCLVRWHVVGKDVRRPLTSVSYRDGVAVGARARGRTITLSEIVSGRVLETIKLEQDISEIWLSEDARRLIISSDNERRLRVHAVDSSVPLISVEVSEEGSNFWADPRAELLALTDRNGLTVWDVEKKAVRFRRPNGSHPADEQGGVLCFSTDSRILAWVPEGGRPRSWTRRIELVDVASGDLIRQQTTKETPVRSLAFSGNGALALYSGDGTVNVFEVKSGRRTHAFRLEVRGVEDSRPSPMTFLPSGRELAVSGPDWIVRICELATSKQQLAVKAPAGRVRTLRAHPSGQALAVSGLGNWAELWDVTGGPSRVLGPHVSTVSTATFSPDGRTIAAGADPDTRLWDAHDGTQIARVRLAQRAKSLGFTSDGSRLRGLYWTGDGAPFVLRSWDVATLEMTEREFPHARTPLPHFGEVRGGHKVTLGNLGERWISSPDGSLLAQSCWHKSSEKISVKIHVLDAATHRPVSLLDGHEEAGTVGLAISHDNAWLASGGLRDGLVKIWDLASGSGVASMAGHEGEIFSLDFSPDRRRLVSGGRDRVVRIWDIEKHFELMAELRGHESLIQTVSFSPDGTQIISAGPDRNLRLWDTVSRSKRFEQTLEARAREEAMVPRIEKLLEQLETRADVAERMRADDSLSREEKQAGERLLLRRADGRPWPRF